ncbi:hypothetical protein EYF80_000475 [Liparis tanakae]|uniref:Uncharacterized protein n=1 Tax=Liparis tanakae TaxID=230148 RepID=A0A4Z2JGV5_9TELE|nr:hypothetical protein EYF80_000475 [Liparis tanakae]
MATALGHGVFKKVASEFLQSASACPLVPAEVREERGRESSPEQMAEWPPRSAAWVFMDTAVSHLAFGSVGAWRSITPLIPPLYTHGSVQMPGSARLLQP